MIQVKLFQCNPFQENTYILFDETKECVIVDPGMLTGDEQNEVVNFIKDNKLKPAKLLNTHCHIDHVLGNKFVCDVFGLLPLFHEGELPLLESASAFAVPMGIQYELSPLPEQFLPQAGTISFGQSELEIIFAPGHSPAHLCFYSQKDQLLIGGDVLFYRSIGRTDLPGGNYAQLIASIKEKLFKLPDHCVVYPGHGQHTTIGDEKKYNPFVS
ncbi:MBL fold metallo-hydrolase [Arcticibacter sp. MXS-1]|uniref:MBL fold metallo-hydrolase n=1 Tax=Arcticibacter sp. MXS-1 TaxID=3341726 RepID=UPI0035A88955